MPNLSEAVRIERCGLSHEQLRSLHLHLRRTRAYEERLSILYRQGKLKGGVYSGIGNEGTSCGTGYAMGERDWLLPMHRDVGAALTRGMPLLEMFLQAMGRADGPCRGRDNGLHQTVMERRQVGMISHLGTMVPIATGVALASRIMEDGGAVVNFIGDGATSTGEFHEGLNMAAVQHLPLVLVIDNNQFAYSTPNCNQFACERLADRAIGYGIPGVRVDGTRVLDVYRAVGEGLDRARRGEGPTLIEALTLRLRGHSEADPAKYVPRDLKEAFRGKDPVISFEAQLIEAGILDASAAKDLRATIEAEVLRAAEEALDHPLPEARSAAVGLWASPPPRQPRATPLRPLKANEGDTFLKGVRAALVEEMERDPRVILLGQDIGHFGGAFKVTEGVQAKFGPERVRDTPIAEAAMIGAGIGAAIRGYRPVVEMQFIDFITCGFNQLVNYASGFHYRTGVPLPMVVRGPCGGRVGGGPFHSRNPEAWFAHQPGLKVVTPSTAEDAKGLLKASIRDDDPVIFLEPKWLYRRVKGNLGGPDAIVPLGRAALRTQGDDVLVITWGSSMHIAVEAAGELEAEGIGVTVLDLRTLIPLDIEAVLNWTKRLGKVLILQEANLTAGFGAELAARIADEAFMYLDGPVKRLGARDVPLPWMTPLENFVLPQTKDVVRALRELARF